MFLPFLYIFLPILFLILVSETKDGSITLTPPRNVQAVSVTATSASPKQTKGTSFPSTHNQNPDGWQDLKLQLFKRAFEHTIAELDPHQQTDSTEPPEPDPTTTTTTNTSSSSSPTTPNVVDPEITAVVEKEEELKSTHTSFPDSDAVAVVSTSLKRDSSPLDVCFGI